MERQVITEEMGVHKEWYKQAERETVDTLPEFINHLLNDYVHDYGTICHALAAGAVATVWAMNNDPHGGITGFQAGAVMWEFVRNWMHEDGPMKLVKYDNMLYPQYEDNFDKVISKETFSYLQEKAKENLENRNGAASRVIDHWQSIVDGNVPFGYKIKED